MFVQNFTCLLLIIAKFSGGWIYDPSVMHQLKLFFDLISCYPSYVNVNNLKRKLIFLHPAVVKFLLGMLTCSPKDVGCNGVACNNALWEDTRFMKEKNSYNYFWQCFLDVLGDQSGNYKWHYKFLWDLTGSLLLEGLLQNLKTALKYGLISFTHNSYL